MYIPPRSQCLKVTWIISVALYLALLPAFFDPKCQAVIVRDFGATTLGIPSLWFFWILVTCLYLPVPWCLSHFVRIGLIERHRSGSFGIFGMFFTLYTLLDFSDEEAPLFRSKIISLCGIGYCLLLIGAWIIHTPVTKP